MLNALESLGSRPVIRELRPLYRRLLAVFRRLRGRRALRQLAQRWEARRPRTGTPSTTLRLSGVPIVVISLPDRRDRLDEFEKEMKRLKATHYRVVPGVAGKELYPSIPGDFSGAIGCNLAHSNAIESNDWSNEQLLMICEDDVEFQVDVDVLEGLISEFHANPNLDVLCLAGRVRGPRIPISDNLAVVTGVVGQACYVVKPHMVEPLARLWRSGVADLARLKLKGKNDIIWNKVQRREAFFAFPRQKIARQRASYSDIQGREMPPQEST